MDDKLDKGSFLAYIHNPISSESINLIYSSNNIKHDKCQLYNDFIQSLIRLAFDTYLGDDIMEIDDQIKHFRWCWNKVIKNFKEEGIIIKNPKLYNYFLEFMLEVFYMYEDKQQGNYIDNGILKIWNDVFNLNKNKTQADVDTLIELYKIFEKSIIFH